jgi:hypothetical protein
MKEARRHARVALRSARYAVGRLEGLENYVSPAKCAYFVEDAESALEDAATDATLALAEFHRACNL